MKRARVLEWLILVMGLALGSLNVQAQSQLNFTPPSLSHLAGQPHVDRITVKWFSELSRIAISTNGTSYRLPVNAVYEFDDGTRQNDLSIQAGTRIAVTWTSAAGLIRIASKVTFEQM